MDFFEEPEVVDELQGLAEGRGHSLGAEIRQALRYWLQVNASEDQEEAE